MSRYALILGLIAAGIFVSGFWPVHLPVASLNALGSAIDYVMQLNGIINMTAFFDAVYFWLYVQMALLGYILFKFILG